MIRRTITHMKTRPRDERIAFAGMVALCVMFVLLIGWAFFFLATIRSAIPPAPSDTVTSTPESF